MTEDAGTKLTWRPMAEFDPSKPAEVHDSLIDQIISWEPDQHRASYEKYCHRLVDGAIAWGGLLLDGWRPHHSA